MTNAVAYVSLAIAAGYVVWIVALYMRSRRIDRAEQTAIATGTIVGYMYGDVISPELVIFPLAKHGNLCTVVYEYTPRGLATRIRSTDTVPVSCAQSWRDGRCQVRYNPRAPRVSSLVTDALLTGASSDAAESAAMQQPLAIHAMLASVAIAYAGSFHVQPDFVPSHPTVLGARILTVVWMGLAGWAATGIRVRIPETSNARRIRLWVLPVVTAIVIYHFGMPLLGNVLPGMRTQWQGAPGIQRVTVEGYDIVVYRRSPPCYKAQYSGIPDALVGRNVQCLDFESEMLSRTGDAELRGLVTYWGVIVDSVVFPPRTAGTAAERHE